MAPSYAPHWHDWSTWNIWQSWLDWCCDFIGHVLLQYSDCHLSSHTMLGLFLLSPQSDQDSPTTGPTASSMLFLTFSQSPSFARSNKSQLVLVGSQPSQHCSAQNANQSNEKSKCEILKLFSPAAVMMNCVASCGWGIKSNQSTWLRSPALTD